VNLHREVEDGMLATRSVKAAPLTRTPTRSRIPSSARCAPHAPAPPSPGASSPTRGSASSPPTTRVAPQQLLRESTRGSARCVSPSRVSIRPALQPLHAAPHPRQGLAGLPRRLQNTPWATLQNTEDPFYTTSSGGRCSRAWVWSRSSAPLAPYLAALCLTSDEMGCGRLAPSSLSPPWVKLGREEEVEEATRTSSVLQDKVLKNRECVSE
jgi:hypothetical protein